MNEVERSTVAKVSRRFIPFLVLCYFVSYLDKVNVGFAALSMNHALGLTPAEFGFGAGIFFVAYCICEVPSNLALARFGARRWLARIMITWGLVSAATAFVSGAHGLYAVRTVLGACEAGFFPGIIYFLTLWFPSQYRARVIGYFMIAIPLSGLIGTPLSSLVLHVNALGLAGWQWLFILEAAPAVVLGAAMLFWLTDRPAEARWLSAAEREWLVGQLDREAQQHALTGAGSTGPGGGSVLRTLFSPLMLALIIVYFGTTALHQSLSFWLPQIVKAFGLSNTQTGFVAAVPYIAGAIGMVVWGRRSDRHGERKGHAAVALGIAAAGFTASAFFESPILKLLALSVAAFGVFAALPVFWTIPSSLLSDRAAAGGIAFVNCLGSLAGFAAPWAIGVIRQETGSFRGGLFLIAATAVVSLLILLVLPLPRVRQRPLAASGNVS